MNLAMPDMKKAAQERTALTGKAMLNTSGAAQAMTFV